MRYHYTELLKNIRNRPLNSPTEEDFKQICPHLDADQIKELRTQEELYFACPPTYVSYSYSILSFNKKRNTLRYAFEQRHPLSYTDGALHYDVNFSFAFMEESSRYALTHWGDELITDNWRSFITFIIDDPSDKRMGLFGGTPKTKMWLYVGINRDWTGLLNDHSKPKSDLIEEAIVTLTTDPFFGNHLKGGRAGYSEFNCACCGGGLSSSACTGCEKTFKYDDFRSSWNTPLPKKITDYMIKQGHQFTIDPQIARTLERKKFCRIKLNSKKPIREEITIPPEFCCALNSTLMTDPVFISGDPTGIRFERTAITEWLRFHGRHPFTRVYYGPNKLKNDEALKTQIDAFIDSFEEIILNKHKM